MKHVPSVQEDLLKIFSERLIPWARQSAQPVVLARPPISAPDNVRVTPVETAVLKPKRHRHSSNILARWPDKALTAARIPYIQCVLDGELDLRIGVTEAMLHEHKGLDPRHGQVIVTLPVNTWILIPPGIPQADGTRGHREPGRPPIKLIRILWINVLPEGLIMHTCETVDSVHTAGPGLFLNGTHFTRIVELMCEELEAGTSRSAEVVKSLQLAFLLSIEKGIAERPFLTVANVEHLATISNRQIQAQGTPGDQALERALRYINAHLHRPLTVKGIASQAYVSPPQLNRLFRAKLDSSVMNYVTLLRIDSARSLLRGTDLSINEISDQVGYVNRTYFSRVFLHATGLSPTAYRRKHRYQGQLAKHRK